VVQILPGQTVTCLHTNSPGHIWTTLYNLSNWKRRQENRTALHTRWFKYDRDWLCLNKSQFVPVIFEPPYIKVKTCDWRLSSRLRSNLLGLVLCPIIRVSKVIQEMMLGQEAQTLLLHKLMLPTSWRHLLNYLETLITANTTATVCSSLNAPILRSTWRHQTQSDTGNSNYLTSLLFFDVTQRKLVVAYRRFRTIYRSRLQQSGSPRRITAWSLRWDR
jgi:hypothetical protein